MTFVSDAKLMCMQNCPPSLRGAVRPCGGGCMSDVGGLWLGVGSGGGVGGLWSGFGVVMVVVMNMMMVAEVGSYVRGYVEVPC